jgi:hypothetical protein
LHGFQLSPKKIIKGPPAGAQCLSRLEISTETETGVLARIRPSPKKIIKGPPAGAQGLSRLEISRETETDILARIPAVTQGPV